MPKFYKLSKQAQDDYDDVLRYIGQDSTIAAERVRDKFDATFLSLAQNPNIGHKRDELTKKDVRFWNLYTYQIIYDPSSEPLNIIRILSGYRDLANMLED